jgi:glycerol-3-phosphate dehydrogenase
VREALFEREVLLRAMPHICWPLRFVLPHRPGLRPAWLVRLGLFIYDHLGGRRLLPATHTLDLARDVAGQPLKPSFTRAFEYSDCWIDDARLVILNARAAADMGAEIAVRTRCVSAERRDGLWRVSLEDTRTGAARHVEARALVNAGGPWVEDVILNKLHGKAPAQIRLVKGSHIVVKRLFDHGKAYNFQMTDGRIVFAIPYESDFTLIGTTDLDYHGMPGAAACTPQECDYLLTAISSYFVRPVGADDIVWTYSGVRPLYDDGAASSTAATRDYVITVEDDNGAAPLLNLFGGKITTYRRLAEAALAKLRPYLESMGAPWTAGAPLPGGDMAVDGVDAAVTRLCSERPFLDERWARRLVRSYGSQVGYVLGAATSTKDLGTRFGWDLTEAEVSWLMRREWAQTADDVLWRRSKLGLRLVEDEARNLDAWMRERQARTLSASAQ